MKVFNEGIIKGVSLANRFVRSAIVYRIIFVTGRSGKVRECII